MRTRRSRSTFSIFLLVLFALTAAFAYEMTAKPARLIDKLQVKSVKIDLSSGHYRVVPALARPGKKEQFSSMIGRLKPYAAITGTYYGVDGCPIGDILIDGKRVCKGCQRQGIGFTRDGRVRFIERVGRARIDWQGCRTGIACGPRLLRGGKKDINVKRDGFSAVAAKNTARRCAVGVTSDGKLIFCAVEDWITLDTLARVMLELGARDAINLDGGSMCALASRGKILIQPMQDMSNILAVYRTK